jgi:hypothetical protein
MEAMDELCKLICPPGPAFRLPARLTSSPSECHPCDGERNREQQGGQDAALPMVTSRSSFVQVVMTIINTHFEPED